MPMVIKKQWQIILCILYKNYTHFHNHSEFQDNLFHFHQYFHCILQLTYLFFSTFTILTVSHSQSQILGFQINHLLHLPLPINSLHWHLQLSSFQRCLLLQMFASNLHLHLQISCHFIYLPSLFLHIRLNTLTFILLATSGTHKFGYGSLILLRLPLHLFAKIL